MVGMAFGTRMAGMAVVTGRGKHEVRSVRGRSRGDGAGQGMARQEPPAPAAPAVKVEPAAAVPAAPKAAAKRAPAAPKQSAAQAAAPCFPSLGSRRRTRRPSAGALPLQCLAAQHLCFPRLARVSARAAVCTRALRHLMTESHQEGSREGGPRTCRGFRMLLRLLRDYSQFSYLQFAKTTN